MRVAGIRSLLPLLLLLIGVIALTPMVLDEPPPIEEPDPEPVEAEERVPRRRSESPEPPVVPEETATIFGRIRGEPNPARPGAWVAVSSVKREFRTTVKSDGSFRFPEVPANQVLSLWLGPNQDGALLQQLVSSITLKPGEVRELDLVVKIPATVCGRIVDEKGEPLADAIVAVLPPDADWRHVGIQVATCTAKNGRFYVGVEDFVLTGPLRVVVDAVGQGYILEERILSVDEMKMGKEIEIRLTMGEKIKGTALDGDGEPIVGASVHILEDYTGDPNMRRPVEGRVKTDRNGRFEDDAYRPGIYWVFLTGSIGGEEIALVEKGVRAGEGDLELRFPGFGSLTYHLVDDRTGEPVAAAEAGIEFIWGHTGENEHYVPWRTLNGKSRATLSKLPQGHYRLWAIHGNYERFTSDLIPVTAGQTGRPITFRLTPR